MNLIASKNSEDSAFLCEELLNFCMLGILPGPGEAQAAYLQRAQDLNQNQNFSKIPATFTEKYNVDIRWCAITHSSSHLRPWEAGATWIDDHSAHIQLSTRKIVWHLCKKNEVISHELVHVMRMAFNEPIFEEIIAHRSSKSALRRFFGPLLCGARDVYLQVGALFTGLAVDWATESMHWSFIAMSALLGYFSARLGYRQLQIHLLKRKFQKFFPNKPFENFLILLTDKEIRRFSFAKGNPMVQYFKQATSLRLRYLASILF